MRKLLFMFLAAMWFSAGPVRAQLSRDGTLAASAASCTVAGGARVVLVLGPDSGSATQKPSMIKRSDPVKHHYQNYTERRPKFADADGMINFREDFHQMPQTSWTPAEKLVARTNARIHKSLHKRSY